MTHLDDIMTQKALHPELRTKLIKSLEKWEVGASLLSEALEKEKMAPQDVAIRNVEEVDLGEREHTGNEETEHPIKKKRGSVPCFARRGLL